MARYMVVSSDCHAGAPWSVYRTYLDAKYREDWDRWVIENRGDTIRSFTKAEMASTTSQTLGTMTPERRKEYLEDVQRSQGHLGNWDPDIRARELDREGIAGEVIFCDGSQKNDPPFGVGFNQGAKRLSPELRLAGARAHNRWLAELCATNPGRHAGVALVPMDDVDETVKEIRWARKNGLFGGIMLPGLRFNLDGAEAFWHHPRYEPVWNVCEELEMPLNAHSGTSGVNYGDTSGNSLAVDPVAAYPLSAYIESHFTAYRPFWFLLFGGVFERHPNLKLACTEAGGMQVLWFNAYLDFLVTYRKPELVRKTLSMKPSEYWHRQCYVGASAHSSRAEIDARQQIGVKNIMWGSDYPHPEGTWPASITRTKELFAGVPEGEVRLMIGENAASVYKFDVQKLRKIAEKIGPKVGDLG